MKKSLKLILFLVIFIFFATGCVSVNAASKTTKTKTSTAILKIFYFKDNAKARTSLFKHPSSINVLAPQSYSIDETGALAGTIDPTILDFTQKHKIKMMPLVTNKSFSKSTAVTILSDTAKQDIAINALITEAEQQKYWGWQIDFEGMDASLKDQFSAFVKRVSDAFKSHDLVLSVAVVSQISSNPADYPNDLWNRVIGVYDYGPLASSADFISVMSYDDPDSTGPVSPYPWLKKVVDYSLKYIPANKLSLGIPLYYWKWNTTSEKLISAGGYTGIQKALKRKGTTQGYSTANQAPFIKYKVKKNHYIIWYENAKSIAKKVALIKQYKLQGFSAWVLGLENPSVYSGFK